MLTSRDSFSATVTHGEELTEIRLSGLLDEAAAGELPGVFTALRPRVRLVLCDLTRITSYGIGLLMRHLGVICREHQVEFAECADVVVDQFQMLDFSRYGRIVSFFARFVCTRCDSSESILLLISRDLKVDRESGAVEPPQIRCPCGELAELDDSLDFVVDHLDGG